MRTSSLFEALGLAAAVSAACDVNNPQDPAPVCNALKAQHPEITFFPGDARYTDNNNDYWTSDANLGPACVFQPTTPELMGFAVETLADSCILFAVRGGGHMPIKAAANIDSKGILLSNKGYTQLQIADDHSTVHVGPGHPWSALYDYLKPFGVSVVGGRIGVVGIPGYLLGGGVSFFGNEFGWASANIVSMTAVLADGSVVNATSDNEYSDLFWALRGGANSFAIVTNFELRTLDIPAVNVGTSTYGNLTGVGEQFLDAVHSYANDGANDPQTMMIPLITYGTVLPAPVYSAFRFYSGGDPNPRAFENFTAPKFSPLIDTVKRQSMSEFVSLDKLSNSIISGWRKRFHVSAFRNSREAIQIIHDTYIDAAKKQLSILNGAVYLLALAVMPVPASFITASLERGGPDPQALDESGAPYIWVEQSIQWIPLGNDDAMEAFIVDVNRQIDANFAKAGLQMDPYLYINDADESQPVWEGYPKESIIRLQSIRDKYDPNRVYTDLMPGGWKVAHADPAKCKR